MSDNVVSAPRDFLGRPVRVGDLIVYPMRRGSRLWMNKAVVRTLKPTPRGLCVVAELEQTNWSGEPTGTRLVNLFKTERLTVVPAFSPTETAA